MRLKSISLSGFKSFVDPTRVVLPSNMCAVVGPNGCGKSNIIDAVRWVMGESSAKTLRGESMTDVIFNGTTQRQPVSQASIELLFDNSSGKITGEFAAYSEIAVRRLVSREGTSDYFLNGNKCRRRDITDLFLGTGLGPRSYAIIEQGMISRLIESKPEDLRVYIEEAAGISKYKERRRETENRMQRTLDNLDRLTDLREELERNLTHLKRQAQAAERYAELKAEERQLKAQLLVLQRRSQAGAQSRAQREIDDFLVEREKHQAAVASVAAEIESLRQQISESNQVTNDLQGQFYSLGSDISRIEQAIQFARERRESVAKDLEQTLEGKQRELALSTADGQRFEDLAEAIEAIEPTLQREQADAEHCAGQLANAEAAALDAERQWDEFTARAAVPRQQVEVQQGRLSNAERNIATLEQRLLRLGESIESSKPDSDSEQLELLTGQLAQAETMVNTEREAIERLKTSVAEHREQGDTLRAQQDELRREIQMLEGQRASLEALQTNSGDADDGAIHDWLARRHFGSLKSVVEVISVDEGYERAAELVLRDALSGLVLDSAQAISADGDKLPAGLTLVAGAKTVRSNNSDSLAHFLSVPSGLESQIDEVRVVDTWDQALSARATLTGRESVVSCDGVWVGADWIKTSVDTQDEAGLLARQRQLTEVVEQIAVKSAQLNDVDSLLQSAVTALQMVESDINGKEAFLDEALRQRAAAESERAAKVSEAEQRRIRVEQLQRERDETDSLLTTERTLLTEAQQTLVSVKEQVGSDDKNRTDLEALREQARSEVQRCRSLKQQADGGLSASQVKLRELLAQREALERSIVRAKAQLADYESREAALRSELPEDDNPDAAAQDELKALLDQRLVVERQLTAARQSLSELEQSMREKEQAKMIAEQAVQNVQGKSESARLKLTESNVRIEQIDTAIAALDTTLAAAEEGLPEEADEAEWQVRVERVSARIHRLGPINLAAIDETSRAEERKEYLDAQNEDLMGALETLEAAIKKIDRETRQRFKDTFDTINAGFSELFPKVFGGGTACLEMTGDDLLDTGVAIMARPPGKKNSTIHLLSGGEKAMTAIALVFSIFQLNPAPFCMLDEVDAPLDDANVGRYARLVREMSQKVQFVFITHNKITMEGADQLMGVTMHEPGVSRLVSVDIEEAARLAAS